MAYTKYSLTPANNNAAPPDGAPEGMLPSAVNDTMRDMMAQIRDVGDGIRGGTYTMTAPVITGGSINGTTIGATTRSTGAFTTLASNGATTFTAGTASTSTTTGTAVITGGLGVSGRINAANFDGIVGANTAAAGNFTTLGATGVATFSAGTVSAPAITTTGDTNTGIFFPAADTIAFTEGGVEAMRIDASGNVGIGTNNPAYKVNAVVTGGSDVFFADANAQSFGGYRIRAGASGQQWAFRGGNTTMSLTDVTAGVDRVVIDSSGNVGIGTSSPGQKLVVQDASASRVDIVRTSGATTRISATSDTGFLGTTTNHPLVVFTNDAERMRILNTGNILSLAGGSTTATGTGIAFPATQSASSDANTLDDYEEGTWTPTLAVNGFNNSRTLSSASGSYTKIGRSVTVRCILNMSGFCRPTSYLQVDGLPFVPNEAFAGSYGGSNAGSGIQGGSVMAYAVSTLIWYPTNGTTESTSWICTLTYFV